MVNLYSTLKRVGETYVRYAEWRLKSILRDEKPTSSKFALTSVENPSANYSYGDWFNAVMKLHRMSKEERNKRFFEMPTPEPDAFLEKLAGEAYNERIQKKRKSTILETAIK